jgi:integrase
MSSASITTRRRATGTRYVVRYRLGGRAYPLQHAGAFRTQKEAKIRLGLVAGELAAGRDPAQLLDAMAERPTVRTFAEWAEAYLSSRIDVGAETRKNTLSHLRAMSDFSERDPINLRVSDVQEWVASLRLKPSSVRRYIATLRAILDFASVEPNPAKDPRVKLPREEPTLIEPPSASDFEAILSNSPRRWRLPLRTLEQTGMRVGEVSKLEWRDVDANGLRFRVRNGKTATARRWVAVPDWLIGEIEEMTPPDDRTPERRVFHGFTPDVAKNVMARACKAAGIAHFHPHDLRHRYASVKIAEGVPVTAVAAQLGHSKKSLTLDVYSHVLLGEGA